MALLALLACYFPIWGLLTMCDAHTSGIPLLPGTKGLLDSFYQLCLVFLRIGITTQALVLCPMSVFSGCPRDLEPYSTRNGRCPGVESITSSLFLPAHMPLNLLQVAYKSREQRSGKIL